MLLKISHTTRYQYERPSGYALQQLRMTPTNCDIQRVIDWHITIEGGSKQVEFTDQHGNLTTLVSHNDGARDICIQCQGTVETSGRDGVVGPHTGVAPLWYFKRETDLTETGPGILQLVAAFQGANSDPIGRLHALSSAILEQVHYETGFTNSATTAEAALAAGHGVCQDHTHIFVAVARELGYPARYVGGYLMMNDRIEQVAGHAWAEAFVDGMGWVGFDVSNGISPDERYIRVSTGLDYSEAAPIHGITIGKDGESMSVSVQVQQ